MISLKCNRNQLLHETWAISRQIRRISTANATSRRLTNETKQIANNSRSTICTKNSRGYAKVVNPSTGLPPLRHSNPDIFDRLFWMPFYAHLRPVEPLPKGRHVITWGSGIYRRGELGLGKSIQTAFTPKIISGIRDELDDDEYVVKVVSGAGHTLALTNSGFVLSWGRNDFGQCGQGHTDHILEPGLVEGIDNVKSIAAGDTHSAAVTREGELFVWGHGESGKLGLGHSRNASTPQRVEHFGLDLPVDVVSCGQRHTCATTYDGDLWAWGHGMSGATGRASGRSFNTPVKVPVYKDLEFRYIDVACGNNHTFMVNDERYAYAIGRNEKYQLGRPLSSEQMATAVMGASIARPTFIPLGKSYSIKSIAAGFNLGAAVTTDKRAFYWGTVVTPTLVSKQARKCAANRSAAYILENDRILILDGANKGWLRSMFRQTLVGGIGRPTDIAVGRNHFTAVVEVDDTTIQRDVFEDDTVEHEMRVGMVVDPAEQQSRHGAPHLDKSPAYEEKMQLEEAEDLIKFTSETKKRYTNRK